MLIHQANDKMDTAILQRFAKLYGYNKNSEDVMPMTILRLRNSSVATVPTLLDLVLGGEMENHLIEKEISSCWYLSGRD